MGLPREQNLFPQATNVSNGNCYFKFFSTMILCWKCEEYSVEIKLSVFLRIRIEFHQKTFLFSYYNLISILLCIPTLDTNLTSNMTPLHSSSSAHNKKKNHLIRSSDRHISNLFSEALANMTLLISCVTIWAILSFK